MNGFLITFYTTQQAKFQGQWLIDWLLAAAARLDILGATVLQALRSVDHRGQMHSAHFFELSDQPVQVQFALSAAQADSLLNYVNQQQLSLFYVKAPVAFGYVGQGAAQ